MCNTLLQLFTTSRIITAATSVLPSSFQSQLSGRFTSVKNVFEFCLIRSTHPEVFFNERYNMNGKVFYHSSCSEYFGRIPRKKLMTELIFSIVTSFQYTLCRRWFSRNFPKIFRTAFSKNTAGATLLISSDYSIKMSITRFNPLAIAGNKRSDILKQTFN